MYIGIFDVFFLLKVKATKMHFIFIFQLGNFTVNFTERYIRGFDQMHEMVKLNNIQTCDSRASSKYSGPGTKYIIN